MAQSNREKVARKLGTNKGMHGFPGIVVDAHNSFGPGGA